MKIKFNKTIIGIYAIIAMAIVGCSKNNGPLAITANEGYQGTGSILAQSLSTQSVIVQDLTQLSAVHVIAATTTGVFSIGWKELVGPNIINDTLIGEAFVVVHDSSQAATRPSGIDLGTVSLSYGSGSIELTKQIGRDSGVVYSTFSHGLHDPLAQRINIPFVSNGTYQFSVNGSSLFTAGIFTITAPASLLDITNYNNGDTISTTDDLTLTWSGGSQTDSVLVRIVPHLNPRQINDRCPGGQPGEFHSGRGFIHEHPDGPPQFNPAHQDPPESEMPFNLGPEFQKGFNKMIVNTGTLTISASDLQNLISGTQSTEIMIDVAQIIEQTVQHDNKALKLILRNGDRFILKVQ